jgi:hypothetical protein
MTRDDAQEPLGDVLSRALDRQEQARQAAKPVTPNLFALAKSDRADAYVAARRRDAGRTARR